MTAEILNNPAILAVLLAIVGFGAVWLLRGQRIGREMMGRISMLSEQQTQLQRVLAEQLQGQERNISKSMEDRLSDLKSRMAVFDAAQIKITELSAHVVDLQDVLSHNYSRGVFGEVQLQNLLQSILPPSAFTTQYTLGNGARVDFLLHMPYPPGPIGIDAKFPLDAYRAMRAAESDQDIASAKKSFSRSIKSKIDDIAAKYIISGETADSALMFIPSESVFAELHAGFEDVLDYSYQKRVWIVSPTTMMATLNTVRAIMRDVKMREQAGVIQNEVRMLIDDVQRLQERTGKLKQYLSQGDDALRQMEVSMDKITRRGAKIMDVDAGADGIDDASKVVQVLKVVE